MGDSSNISYLGIYFSWVVELANIPLHMWGYTFTLLQVIYGTTFAAMITGFFRRLSKRIGGYKDD